MNRKANRSVPLLWIVSLIGLIVLSGGGIYFTRAFLADPYRGVPELPAEQYVDNSLSFRGNTYEVTGKVENQLTWSEMTGRLFSFEANPDGSPVHIAILLPPVLDDVNVQKGQSFEIKIKVADRGLLEATEIRKS